MDPWAANAFVATMELTRGRFAAGDALPPFWHWMYFKQAAPRSALGPDGHPALGGFMPKVAQSRRMWAGGRLEVHGAIPLGAPATRLSTVANVVEKTGRSGRMSFVTLRHEISGAAGLALVEEQDIVYRDDSPPGAPVRTPPMAPGGAEALRLWTTDATTLFRYSALTFNGHRIHYDLDHARETEGYPGLVVHGPLLATLLLELATELRGVPARFAFRATAPIFAGERFEACAAATGSLSAETSGIGLALWMRGEDGRLAMSAEADW